MIEEFQQILLTRSEELDQLKYDYNTVEEAAHGLEMVKQEALGMLEEA